ncbi:MAG: glutathione S-transferase family protein [Candidatus Omnitrophica bacterium]|nr:glutathione S-transferase family protein [Candidatus Omnitrophota bacterium]
MLTIYGSDLSSPANKVRFVANHLGLKYEYKKVDLGAGEQKKPEFLKVNPVGKVPAIDDDGFMLYESGAIIKYLAEKAGSSILPKGLKERASFEQDLDFITLHVGMAAQKIVFNRVFAPRRNIPIDTMSLQDGETFLKRFLPIVDARLAKTPYYCGNALTLVDFTLLSILDPSEMAGIDLSPYANITKWRNNLRQQDFYTKCHKEYGDALKQPAKA